jgi:DnaJ-class molecular chaperone
MNMIKKDCPNCDGQSKACKRCNGSGKVETIVKTEYERRLERTERFYEDQSAQLWRD